jgi:hypothetical protein
VELVPVALPAVVDAVVEPEELLVPVDDDPVPEVPDVPLEVPVVPAVPVDLALAECAGSSWATTPTNAPVPNTADANTQRVVRRTRSKASSRWFVWYRRGDPDADAMGGTPLLMIRSLPGRLKILPTDPKNR